MIGVWSLESVREQLDGRRSGEDRVFSRVVTDSRKCAPGDLFVALKGERFDGHTFAAEMTRSQVAALLVEKELDSTVPQLIVDDAVKALGKLGRINRQRFAGPVVAITGSNGKTTVKEMVAAILSRQGEVCWTEGNLNNHLGVPLTLLRLEASHHFGVFELGANHKGEIAYTVQLAQPDVAILNNAGDAHLEGFGSHQGIAEGKGEIISGLPAAGVAILNRTSAFYDYWKSLAGDRKCLAFGWEGSADVFATDVTCHDASCEFNLHVPGRVLWVKLPLAGRHNVLNALAAAAAAVALGIPPETIVAGLADVKTVGGRLRQCRSAEGALIIDDTYNASPASMKAGLDVISTMPGKRIAVLGHMAELGDYAAQSHREIGAYARGRVDELWVMGNWAGDYAEGYGTDCIKLSEFSDAIARMKPLLSPGLTVLVKGSRSAGMERVVNGILQNNHNTERSTH